MAILVHLPGIEVTVCSDGRDLREHIGEHEPLDEDPYTTTRYIEAKDNLLFSIKLSVEQQYAFFLGDALTFRITVDGRRIAKMALPKSNRTCLAELQVYGPLASNGMVVPLVHPMRFTRLKFKDGPLPKRFNPFATTDLHAVGSIVVKVSHRWQFDSCKGRIKAAETRPRVFETGPVWRQAIRGKHVSHCMAYA